MKVTIAAAQYPITEHKTFADWRTHIEEWVADAARQQAQLVLFPEYGSMELVSLFNPEVQTDLTRQVRELDSLRQDFCQAFADLARQYNLIIVAPTLPVIEEGNLLNRAYVFSAKGMVGYQDKFFMTRFEDEEWGINSAPKTLTLFDAPWGSFGIQICFDVEFALGSQWLSAAGASLILAPSCTESLRGSTRVHVGARARALENQAFTVVSQTIGVAPWSPVVDVNYGYAAFYCTPDKDMPEEGIISTYTPQKAGWLVQTLDFTQIESVRQDGQVFNFKHHSRLAAGFVDEPVEVVRRQV
ncbi:carbon-nitrogen hydrolase family protein [Telluribacter humicola]|uniref:carbon-nitrogen hydrolase family protein n=1 Tax=Telluribacter humicola TaxID=1720261 RepID=UPI001A96ECAD|nr:carbon-nitrogen hydrolase family protein [Telluribacter humicola]